jgi:glycosyltransferase involved in cell wall biosynthesis
MAEVPAISVLMVSAGFHPTMGGAEKQALELSLALAQRGLKVRVATRRLPGLAPFEEIRGVPVVRLWCAGRGFLNAASFLTSLWIFLCREARSYDVIHVHLAGSPAVAAALAGRLLHKRVFIKLGGGKGIGELATSSRTTAGRVKLAVLRLLKPQFIAVAKELAQEAATYLGAVPVHIVPNGVDTQVYSPAGPLQKGAVRSQLGWPEQMTCFLYVGRFSPEKRLPMFVEAWIELVKKTGAKAIAAFVGEGIEGALIKDAADHERFSDNVFIHAPMAEVAQAYAAADVFVLPSVSEGLSNSLLEAMASGLAVLGSRVGGTAEAVVDAETGFLFDPGDTDELKRQLRKFLERPELIAKMGLAARRTALERYSMAKVAQTYEELYRWGV